MVLCLIPASHVVDDARLIEIQWLCCASTTPLAILFEIYMTSFESTNYDVVLHFSNSSIASKSR